MLVIRMIYENIWWDTIFHDRWEDDRFIIVALLKPQFAELFVLLYPLVAGLQLFGPNVLFKETFLNWMFSVYLGSNINSFRFN